MVDKCLNLVRAPLLSCSVVSRLKKQWVAEHAEWLKPGLSEQRYAYWWAGGVYSNVRMDDRLCLLVIIRVTEQGRKELVVNNVKFQDGEPLTDQSDRAAA